MNINWKSNKRCLEILKYLYLSRFTDEKMNKLVKQNKGTTFFLSHNGHELIGILSALSLKPKKDWFFPYYRDRAFVISIGAPLLDLFASFLARDSFHHSSGRMMPDHFCDNTLNIACQSSCVSSQYLQAVGVAKAFEGNEIVYVSGGDGSTSEGDFHEALNFASIHKLSVLFVIQDNEYAISVTKEEQTAGSIAKIALGYENLKVLETDGTNYLQTSNVLNEAVDYLRNKNGPVLVVAKVPRLGAHSISDDPKKYKSEKRIQEEIKKDPVVLFEKFLVKEKIINENEIEKLKREIFNFVEEQAQKAEEINPPKKETITKKVFVDFEIKEKEILLENTITFMDGLNHALKEEMAKDDSIIVFGQDVADKKGGVFGVTRGLTDQFGKKRCFNTPLAESTIIGVAIGMSIAGKKPVCEIQFADYVWSGINQLVNELASIYYRSNGEYNCPVVVRIPFGGYIQGGPYHSQSIESHLCHVPGLKIVAASNAKDAKMLLKAAIKDPNPVVFLEHKAIYRQRNYAATNEPSEDSILPFGMANIIHPGEDVTIVCYSMMVMFALEIAKKLSKEGMSIEVIDLRTLVPLDLDTIINSVKKTSKLIILHEDKVFCGFGAEIASLVMENAFDYLDAPIKRIGALNVPIPYAKVLENEYFPQKETIEKEIRKLINF
jgi:2-oxoisovalerate dehydrogenase E1 component